jgi:hypothetical protein
MRAYPFKRGYKPTEERLEEMIKKHFNKFRKDSEYYVVSFGAIEELRMKIEGKKLVVETKTDPKAPEKVAVETIKKYNRFLHELTGYSSKERQKLMKKEVEKQ